MYKYYSVNDALICKSTKMFFSDNHRVIILDRGSMARKRTGRK